MKSEIKEYNVLLLLNKQYMNKKMVILWVSALLLSSCVQRNQEIVVAPVNPSPAEIGEDVEYTNTVSFFITSVNPWSGANLWGLTWADAYCQSLASNAWYGDKTWRAYLSTSGYNGGIVTHARDRIGTGPWYNVRGVLIASNLEELHSNTNVINKENGLDENGNIVMGRGDEVNMHDILTWSRPDGTATGSTMDTTCSNWTSGTEWSAIVGHHDRMWLDDSDAAKSWNSSHASRGCSLENLRSTWGAGLIYCFAK